jgi:hypothetical protein
VRHRISVHHRRVMPNANRVPSLSRYVLRPNGARFNEASHVSNSAVEMSARVRSGNAEQNLVKRNRRSLQYRALAPAARRFLSSSRNEIEAAFYLFAGHGVPGKSQIVGAKTISNGCARKHRRFDGNSRYSGLSASSKRKLQSDELRVEAQNSLFLGATRRCTTECSTRERAHTA